jgi:hypothetical protein
MTFKSQLYKKLIDVGEENQLQKQYGYKERKISKGEQVFTHWKRQSNVMLEELLRYFKRSCMNFLADFMIRCERRPLEFRN